MKKLASFLVEASYLSQYAHPSYKKKEKKEEKVIEKLHLIIDEKADREMIEEGIKEGSVVGKVVNEVRTLVNKPANHMTPTHLANHARGMARDIEQIECEVFDRDKIASMGMGGLIGVSKGSKEMPYLIKCQYTPKMENSENLHTVALVGKGVTFDSGGISIKPRQGMYRMKDDMAGAALFLGIMKISALLNLPIKLLGIIPTCENLPGGNCFQTRRYSKGL